MTIDYVALKSPSVAARSILKNAAVETSGDVVVVLYNDWVKTAIERATTVLTAKQRETWNTIHYLGPTDKGFWLAGANALDVTKAGGVPVWRGRYVHVSEAVYAQLRAKYFVWWAKAKECEGWSHIVPGATDWLPANDPNPSEMKAYKGLVDRYFSTGKTQSIIASAMKEDIDRRSIRCDRDLKLFNLAKAKATK